MNTLIKIISAKKKLVAEQKELFPTKLLEKSIYYQTEVVSLRKYVLRPDKHGIIAEIKKKSPSKGILNNYIDVEKVSIGYMQAGASALSVITDELFFGGNNKDFIKARSHNFCPILRKDFIIDPYQIIESKSIGADAILLIASILTKSEVANFTLLAKSLGLEVLLEIHDADELDKISQHNTMVGINNRSLKSLTIDLSTAESLFPHIKTMEVKITESGIENIHDLLALKSLGFNGFLIGSHFMKHSQPHLACKQLINELQLNPSDHASS